MSTLNIPDPLKDRLDKTAYCLSGKFKYHEVWEPEIGGKKILYSIHMDKTGEWVCDIFEVSNPIVSGTKPKYSLIVGYKKCNEFDVVKKLDVINSITVPKDLNNTKSDDDVPF